MRTTPVNESKYTPGQWTYSGVDRCIMAHGPNRLRFVVADVSECFDPEVTQANMLLIASAPALLEALQKCSEYFAAIDAFQPTKKHGCVGDQVRMLARAAIAQATGALCRVKVITTPLTLRKAARRDAGRRKRRLTQMA